METLRVFVAIEIKSVLMDPLHPRSAVRNHSIVSRLTHSSEGTKLITKQADPGGLSADKVPKTIIQCNFQALTRPRPGTRHGNLVSFGVACQDSATLPWLTRELSGAIVSVFTDQLSSIASPRGGRDG